MRAQISPRTVRRLVAADGYLDLRMPDRALDELDQIEDAGFYEAPRAFLTGRALMELDRHDEAIGPLEQAARLMPSPHRRLAWQALSECYTRTGSEQLAQIAQGLAGPGKTRKSFRVVLPSVEVSITLEAVESREEEEDVV